jgi:hypothetical protein
MDAKEIAEEERAMGMRPGAMTWMLKLRPVTVWLMRTPPPPIETLHPIGEHVEMPGGAIIQQWGGLEPWQYYQQIYWPAYGGILWHAYERDTMDRGFYNATYQAPDGSWQLYRNLPRGWGDAAIPHTHSKQAARV